MTIQLQPIAQNAAADAIVDLVDAGAGAGVLQIATASFASILATITLQDPAYGAASAGSAALLGTPLSDTSADNTGTAAVWRIRDSNSNVVFDGPAATSGGGDINLSTTAQRAALDAIAALCNGGDIQFTTAGDTGFASPIATLPLNATAFASATGAAPATAAMNTGTAVQANASGSGTATLFRFRRSAGNSSTPVFSGTVGTSGADINFNSNVFAAGVNVQVNSFTLSQPATTSASDGAIVLGSTSITSGQAVTITSGSYLHPDD